MSCFSRSLNCSSSISRYVFGYTWGLDLPKKSFDWDIILEHIALFANTFFKYKFLVMDYVGSSNECAVFCAHGLLKSTHSNY